MIYGSVRHLVANKEADYKVFSDNPKHDKVCHLVVNKEADYRVFSDNPKHDKVFKLLWHLKLTDFDVKFVLHGPSKDNTTHSH